MSKPPIEFTNKYSILLPKGQIIYSIAERDLSQLEKLVGRLDHRAGGLHNLAYCTIGLAGNAVFSLIGTLFVLGVPVWIWVFCWVMLCAPLAVSAVAFWMGHREKQNFQATKQDILEHIQLIKDSVDNPPRNDD